MMPSGDYILNNWPGNDDNATFLQGGDELLGRALAGSVYSGKNTPTIAPPGNIVPGSSGAASGTYGTSATAQGGSPPGAVGAASAPGSDSGTTSFMGMSFPSDILVRGVVVVLGFIFVAIGLSMFRVLPQYNTSTGEYAGRTSIAAKAIKVAHGRP